MVITIDTSAILAVLVNEENKQHIITKTEGCILQAPESLDAEIGNALSAMVKRGKLKTGNALEIIRQFNLIQIRRTPIRLVHTMELVKKFKIYAYDGYILDCALQYRTPLLSLDKKMIEVAKTLQIPVLTLEP